MRTRWSSWGVNRRGSRCPIEAAAADARVRHRCRDLLSEGIKLLIPTREECANCESLYKGGSDKDARSGPSYRVRSDFSHQAKGSGRECIGTLGDANNQRDGIVKLSRFGRDEMQWARLYATAVALRHCAAASDRKIPVARGR